LVITASEMNRLIQQRGTMPTNAAQWPGLELVLKDAQGRDIDYADRVWVSAVHNLRDNSKIVTLWDSPEAERQRQAPLVPAARVQGIDREPDISLAQYDVIYPDGGGPVVEGRRVKTARFLTSNPIFIREIDDYWADHFF